jgi:Deoxyribonuclease II
MKRILGFLLFSALLAGFALAQTAVVTRNVNLRPTPSNDRDPSAKLTPGTGIQLLQPGPTGGYYRVQTSDGKTGYVWGRNIRINAEATISKSAHAVGPAESAQEIPTPLLTKGHPVNWWFVFKFNSSVFPGCDGGATRTCPFGGEVQNYRAFSQRFVYASSEVDTLQEGNDCAGDTTADPIGATFEEVYDNSFHYVIWNDQFYDDPEINGCSKSCNGPWGHSKGMVAWNDSGEGFVLQVTTPSWPAAGSKQFPRKTDGNTLGCVKDNDVQVSQDFFALKLTKDDLVKVLTALRNASVVTDPKNPQVVNNGGPTDIQSLVAALGAKSSSRTYTQDTLSSGVELISKPSDLNVPPWQLVSAILGGVPLRAATWWTKPMIYTTTSSTTIACWDDSLPKPGPVEIATTGHWTGKEFGLTGGLGTNFNHAKVGVSTGGDKPYSIFGDMNQQGTASGLNCSSSQNGRGGLFYVVNDAGLSKSLTGLIAGGTAPTAAPPK